MKNKKLYRSKKDKVIGGVAGGMAEYFSADVTLMRLIWVALFLSGIGLPVYLLAWIFVPLKQR